MFQREEKPREAAVFELIFIEQCCMLVALAMQSDKQKISHWLLAIFLRHLEKPLLNFQRLNHLSGHRIARMRPIADLRIYTHHSMVVFKILLAPLLISLIPRLLVLRITSIARLLVSKNLLTIGIVVVASFDGNRILRVVDDHPEFLLYE